MLEFFRKLFSTDFMPHVYCLRLPSVIWLHVVSDGLIAASYFLIPAALVLLTRRRRDLAFSWMFGLFGLFILACGSTHLLNIYTLWHPIYRFDGVVKAVTALASLPTAVLLFRLLPQAVALPSPAQLRQEVEDRKAAEGNVRKLNSQLEDLVTQRTAELAASEARFKAAVECVSDIVWTNSPDGRMTGEQKAWGTFTGQTQDEYHGYGWANAVHEADAQPSIDAWNQAVAKRAIYIVEHRVRRSDGEYRLFAVRGVPVLDKLGAIREWVGVHTDITEDRAMQEELRRAKSAAESASRAKSAFLASMSHELRTPLNAILGYTEIMEEEAQENGSVAMVQDLQRVHGAGRHLLGLVSDVLDLSKIETGRMELETTTFRVAEMARSVAQEAQPLFDKQANRFEIEIAEDVGALAADEPKLRQCLRNLLSNAAKFTEHGKVKFEVLSPSAESVLFLVTDSGIGITPDHLDRIFEPFTQGDGSYERRFGGTGLGLALTRHLVKMMGGEILVSSTPGEGSVFSIQLPRSTDHA